MASFTALDIGDSAEEEKHEEIHDDIHQPNTLQITVLRARGLRKSALRSTISAYVKLMSAGKTQKTKVMSKTIEPVWNETFSFRATDWTSNVTLEVRDKINVAQRNIGQLRIVASDIATAEDRTVKKWFPLVDKNWQLKTKTVSSRTKEDSYESEEPTTQPQCGEIQLEVKWIYLTGNDPILRRRSTIFANTLRVKSESGRIESMEPGFDDWKDEELEGLVPEQDEETDQEQVLRKMEIQQYLRAKELTNEAAITRGNYQICVHIIETRDLKGEDLSGSSDPVCYVEVMGQKRHTAVKYNTQGCVFDEIFFFDFIDIGRRELQEGIVKISVFDKNRILRNTLIGVHQLDCLGVYTKENHEIYRQWLGLMDYDNADDQGIQGFLLASVSILGPGDTPKVHDRDAEIADEYAGDMGMDVSTMIVMPPLIQQKLNFLVVHVYKAEDIPAMDSSGVLSSSGIDAFMEVEFAGNPAFKTNVVTVKGDEFLTVEFLEELWIPYMVPTMNQRVSLSLWDHDKASANDLVGRFSYFLSDIEAREDISKAASALEGITEEEEEGNEGEGEGDAGAVADRYLLKKALAEKSKMVWINLYGPPLRDTKAKFAEEMKRYPDTASTYRGRVLLRFERVTDPAENTPEVCHSKDILDEDWEKKTPAEARYTLRIGLISGSDLPQFFGLKGSSKIKIVASIGQYTLPFEAETNRDGSITWATVKEKRGMVLPADLTMIPDIFIHLCRQADLSDEYVSSSFLRLKAIELVQKGFGDSSPTWYFLREDSSRRETRYGMEKNEYPGSLLLKVGFGREEIAAMSTWSNDFTVASRTLPYQIRAHVFQCRGLRATDLNNNSSDPYVLVSFGGKRKRTKRARRTTQPLFYETVVFNVDAPKAREYAPDVVFQIYDYSQYGRNEFLGQYRVHFADGIKTSSSSKNAPHPKWFPIYNITPGDTDNTSGEILLSLQIIEKQSRTEAIASPASLIPEYREAYFDIIALGVRKLKPYRFLNVQRPYVEFEVLGGQFIGKKSKSRRTRSSSKPDGPNANFLDRLIMPVKLPRDAIFSPHLKMKVYDSRLGGIRSNLIATTVIDLYTKLPWNVSNYIAPQQQEFDHATKQVEKRQKQGFVSDDEGENTSNEEEVEESAEYQRKHDDDDDDDDEDDDDDYDDDDDNVEKGVPTQQGSTRRRSSIAPKIKNRPPRSTRRRSLEYSEMSEEYDDGSGVGSLQLPVIKIIPSEADVEDDPAIQEQRKQEVQRRYAAACADAKKKGTFVRMENFLGEHGFEDSTVLEDETPIDDSTFMKGRDWWINMHHGAELEGYMKTTPFETYCFYNRTRLWSFRNESRVVSYEVGRFKGLVRVVEADPSSSSNPFIDYDELKNPQPFTVRVYILKGKNLQPKDLNGLSDPYVSLKLGKKKITDRKNHLTKTLNPNFFKSFEFETTIPGPSQLEISVWDYDRFSGDDLIGTTTLDLEDRWFHKEWQKIGEGHPELSRQGCLKPVEFRHLWTPTATTSQGALQLWVDIMPIDEAKRFQLVNIEPPPKQKVEVRVIIWKSEEIFDRDYSEVNDLYARVWMEGTKPQTTDVHWRCSTGNACWNYRLKFQIDLPLQTSEYGRLHIQLWDKDVIKWNDIIGETQLDLYKWIQKAYIRNEIVQPFKEMRARKENQLDSEPKQQNAVQNPETNGLDSRVELVEETNPSSLEHDLDDMESGIKSPLLRSPTNTTSREGLKSRFKGLKSSKGSSSQVNPASSKAIGDGKRKEKIERKQKNEAKDAIGSFLDLIGMGRLADDAEWITLYYTDREKGSSDAMGKLAVSVQIVPEEEAKNLPVGTGRDDPNVNPYLPPPVGRMKVSANPFMVIKELVGPKMCLRIVCLFCCVFCMGFIAVFGAGLMSTLTFIEQQEQAAQRQRITATSASVN